MITDIFAWRYPGLVIRTEFTEADRRLMNQVARMITGPLWVGFAPDKESSVVEASLRSVHDRIATEYGIDWLSDRWWFQNYEINGNKQTTARGNNYCTICKVYLEKAPQEAKGVNAHVLARISFIEQAFQERWREVQTANAEFPAALARAKSSDTMVALRNALRVAGLSASGVKATNDRMNVNWAQSVHEINERLKQAGYGLTFHNGLIQIDDDPESQKQIATPFWSLVGDPCWSSVDEQIKEAIDRRDRADRTAAFHAVCALESCLKVISDLKGWTRGSEKGASHYINNLNSKANGRFLEVWEAEMLTKMFSDVRNPFAHGPGQDPMPQLSVDQADWAIGTSMSWIKTLIRRL
jgi:hypothetical protein